MKEYPSIPRDIRFDVPVYVFDKLDGSNVRAEWSRKKGFWKFGKRHGLLDHSNPILLKAEPLIKEKYSEDLNRIFRDQRWQKAIAFFEFWGPLSFAGNHETGDIHTVTLIEIAGDKKGFVMPRDFVQMFENVDHARLLHHGNFTDSILEEVRAGTLKGMTFEGVVCKGAQTSPGLPLMFKVKSIAWMEKLRKLCGDNETMFQKML